MNEVYELPNGWDWKPLGEITNIVGGGTPKRNINEYWGNGHIVWLSPTDLGEIGEIGEVSDSKDKITQLGLDKSSAKLLPIGTVLYSSRATIGKISINTVEVSTNQGFANFICNENLYNRYLAFCLSRFTSDITSLSNSTTFKEVSKTNLKEFKIPLPPLPEQKRIVLKLDLLFEKIAKSIALHQKNMDEADVFMGSVLNEVFGELEEKYEIKTLNDVCDKITDGTHSSPKTVDSGYPYITVRDVTDKGKIDFDNCEFVNENDFQRLKDGNCAPIENDVLFSKDGTVGKVTVVDYQKDFVVLSSLAILRPSNNMDSFFLFYTMKTPKFFEFAQSKKTGAAIKRVVLRTIKEFEVPHPPLNIQQKVVKYLDEISSKIEKVKSVQNEKMDSLKALKASILDKAFRGEL